jgi:hypothetical protein
MTILNHHEIDAMNAPNIVQNNDFFSGVSFAHLYILKNTSTQTTSTDLSLFMVTVFI